MHDSLPNNLFLGHMTDTPLLAHRQQISIYGQDLFYLAGIELDNTNELQRQACGAFLFGFVFAHGRIYELKPPEIHALLIAMLMDVLNYSGEQANSFSSELINATAAGPEDTTRAIIHRGIDGHYQLTSSDYEELRNNILGIFSILGVPYAA